MFSLIPLDIRTAKGVLDHPDNRHLVSLIPGVCSHENPQEVARGLNIGFQISTKSSHTLATIGRTGNITVEGSSISRIQCSFEIHKDTEEIFLCDRSSSWSTQTFGPSARPFERERPDRRVVVARSVNEKFGFSSVSYREDHPRFTRTVDDETQTALPSKRATRIHTPGVHGPANMIRYYKKESVGFGSYGEVYKAVNVDSGELLALKLVKWPERQSYQYTMLKREVETLARLSHPNIVEFVSAQGFGEECLEISTPLKQGNIHDLIEKEVFVKDHSTASLLLHHMLQAIDYVAFKGIVHRDVKPANILYTSQPNGAYTFQLADFGLCNLIADARTCAGSPIFMAPEVFSSLETSQTSKMDVWSLFVTQAYAMNVGGFRGKPSNTTGLKIRAVQEAANDPMFRFIQDMAIVDPERRASAAEMLEKLYNGEGRSTPRNACLNSARGVDTSAVGPRKQRTKQSRIMKNVSRKQSGQVLKDPVTTEKRRIPG
ncbi:calcium/calmodulin-dependent protein kinase [Melanomma pulvis-pyrius CBS 109.77]|uniref:mitogen-activated protein kinase n=1 Tax=Melanomma pulvis-pyrius CBS 109.77 TaxID=1314802 RepID=A0A6A6XB34_9PLEO|nr:calcium/calmodulin-dependent protein kinase [Melanomma pulvis-pyrius CBS 109.77]